MGWLVSPWNYVLKIYCTSAMFCLSLTIKKYQMILISLGRFTIQIFWLHLILSVPNCNLASGVIICVCLNMTVKGWNCAFWNMIILTWLNMSLSFSPHMLLLKVMYTERQKKLITSSERRSLKSKALKWLLIGHRLAIVLLTKHI